MRKTYNIQNNEREFINVPLVHAAPPTKSKRCANTDTQGKSIKLNFKCVEQNNNVFFVSEVTLLKLEPRKLIFPMLKTNKCCIKYSDNF